VREIAGPFGHVDEGPGGGNSDTEALHDPGLR
jgi:hypothetical protein